MSVSRRQFLSVGAAGITAAALPRDRFAAAQSAVSPNMPSTSHSSLAPDYLMPRFVPVLPELFGAPGAQTNCWADFDSDGDLDLFVGFKGGLPNRLYRNDGGTFAEVAQQAGIADLADTRGTQSVAAGTRAPIRRSMGTRPRRQSDQGWRRGAHLRPGNPAGARLKIGRHRKRLLLARYHACPLRPFEPKHF